MEDKKIIDLYWQRDESAIEETQKKYDRYCYSIAYHILSDGEDSRECVNDTYLGAWNAIPPARPNGLQTFIGRICRNLALKIRRAATAEKRGGGEYDLVLDEIAECIPAATSVEDHMEEETLVDAINTFLDGLSSDERRIFVSRYWYFDPIAEIAKRYGFGESKVKMSLKRTRDRLEGYLRNEGIVI